MKQAQARTFSCLVACSCANEREAMRRAAKLSGAEPAGSTKLSSPPLQLTLLQLPLLTLSAPVKGTPGAQNCKPGGPGPEWLNAECMDFVFGSSYCSSRAERRDPRATCNVVAHVGHAAQRAHVGGDGA